MSLEEIARLLDLRMFTPFRISLTDGRSFDVVHPQQCFLMARSVIIGLPSANLPPNVAGDYVHVALIHITSLQPIAAPSTSSGNGQAAQ